ncbi:MAG: hypothetical protein ACTSPY_05520 [Candidatus Helarchaeota archaeon]
MSSLPIFRSTFLYYIKDYFKIYENWLLDEWRVCIAIKRENKKLVKNRILGLILLFNKLSTEQIVDFYNRYFDILSRSTISKYLNELYDQDILDKEKKGKEVSYFFKEIAVIERANPFWFSKNICPTPKYLYRLAYFARKLLKIKIEKKLDDEIEIIVNLIVLKLISNKFEKCVYCNFSDRKIVKLIKEQVDRKFSNKSSVLNPELKESIDKYAELNIFGGDIISYNVGGKDLPKELLEITKKYRKELTLQKKANKIRKNGKK